jgi:hypothetical protein
MKTEVFIHYKDIPLMVVGNYTEGQSRVMYYNNLDGQDEEPSEFDISAVYVDDGQVSILDLLRDSDLREIELLVIESVES